MSVSGKRKRWRTDVEAERVGFRWGQVDCVRYFNHNRSKMIAIETDRQVVHVWVTPSGLIRAGKPYPQRLEGAQ